MDFFSNYYRKYLGLKLVDDSTTCYLYEKDALQLYVYSKENKIVKILRTVFTEDYMSVLEKDVLYEIDDNHEFLLPKTIKGKPKKISISVLNNLKGIGTYFHIFKEKNKVGHCIIGNYTTQKSYYEDTIKEDIISKNIFKEWLDKYVEETTDDDLKEIQEFSNEKRKHINYQEGDYFRVKIGRHEYGYGRILMDISKRKKQGMLYFISIGKPLIIEMFHIITKEKNVSISKLEKLPTFPSQHIFDNNIYFGEYEIIGNKELPSNIKYPIMYGRTNGKEENIFFQCGEIHKEIPYNNNLIKRSDQSLTINFRNNGIGYTVEIDSEMIKKSILEESNQPFWDHYAYKKAMDLRCPDNKKYLIEVLKQFNLDFLYEKYND